jgi:hypothetical protein
LAVPGANNIDGKANSEKNNRQLEFDWRRQLRGDLTFACIILIVQ